MMGKGSKVVVCGSAFVGKTAILEQLLYGNHTVGVEYSETLEDIYIASIETERGVKEQLRLFDTQGLQEAMELPKHYFSFADAFVLVYSVDNLESFRRVEMLKREVDMYRDKKEVAIVVLGNKADLADQRQVDTEMAQHWAKSERVKLWEVSVTERKTLIEPFTLLASKLNQPQSKTTFPLPGRKTLLNTVVSFFDILKRRQAVPPDRTKLGESFHKGTLNTEDLKQLAFGGLNGYSGVNVMSRKKTPPS